MMISYEGGSISLKYERGVVSFVQMRGSIDPQDFAGIAQFFADAERRANTRYVLRKGNIFLGDRGGWSAWDPVQFTEDERPAAEVLAAKFGAEVVPL